MIFRRVCGVAVMGMMFLGGCTNRTATGGAIGSVTGGVIGAVIGEQAGNAAVGAIIGAAVGGVAGAAIGTYMDRQAEELRRDLAGAEVQRVGEGIRITLSSGILFDPGSADLQPGAHRELRDLATVLQRYEDTRILIVGHTDSTGSAQFNQRLSEQRAETVADFLRMQGVRSTRIVAAGRGETQPVESNDTEEGRRRNRRVEVAIYADDKLKRAARRGEIGGVSSRL